MEESTIIRESDETQQGSARPGRGSDQVLRRGASLGRYVVLERLGAGGMGSVYAAFDPKLDRRVALKVLHPALAKRDPSGPARLVREAQALAQLVHPNVVTVHDVGQDDDRVFVAMELVEGQTLKAWLATQSREPSETLACCIAAGRGLAAAHRHGLVHRDFKPDNVMVGGDGRVLVMDFGLARGFDGALGSVSGSDLVSASASASASISGSASDLTQTGTILGTPAYMSPEQLDERQADARSDQFSFCVTVWEALYGERPFRGDSLATLAHAVRTGEMSDPPKKVAVPSRVRAALRRGLLTDPSARFDDMDALLLELEPPTRRMGPRLALLGAAAVAAFAVATLRSEGPTEEPCTREKERVAEVWNEEREAAIGVAFEATGVSFAVSTWTRSREALDTFFTTWATTHVAVCRATRVAGEQSEARLDLRMDCLDDAMRHGTALLTELADADAPLVTAALKSVLALPDPAICREVTGAQHDLSALDKQERNTAKEAMRLYATAKARADSGRTEAAAEAVQAAEVLLEGIDAPSVRAALLLVRSRTEQGEAPNIAEQTLKEGLAIANRLPPDRVHALLWLQLLHVMGQLQQKPKEALALELPTSLAVERVDDDAFRIQLADRQGLIRLADGRADESLEYFDRALELAERMNRKEVENAKLYNNRALALAGLGRWKESIADQKIALERSTERYGEEHPAVAIAQSNLARGYQAKGDLESARTYFEKALATRRQVLGPNAPGVADSLLNLGILNNTQERTSEAKEQVTEAKRIYEIALGPDHPHVGLSLIPLGIIAQREGNNEDALKMYAQSETILRARYGDLHPHLAAPLVNQGSLYLDLERFDESIAALGKALAVLEASQGPEHERVAFPLMGLGQAYLALGKTAEAAEHIERALAVREGLQVDPRLIAEVQYVLGKVRWAEDRKEEAVALVRKAAETTRPDGPTSSPEIHDLATAWLAENGQGRRR